MPVKNVGAYVADAVASIQQQKFQDWQLVVVDDNSHDTTPAIVTALMKTEPRLTYIRSDGQGIVHALNLGYRSTSGEYIKFIDGDDALAESFSEAVHALTCCDASYHDADIVRSDLTKLASLRMTSKFRDDHYSSFFRPGVVSPPRWAWTFSRTIGDALFPLPASLSSPHEDYWVALAIKRRARSLNYVPTPVYFYRQHDQQFFGGLFNYSPRYVIPRAQAMLKILDLIEGDTALSPTGDPGAFQQLQRMKIYYSLMGEDTLSLRRVAQSQLRTPEKLKLLVIKKAPRLAAALSRRKSGISSKLVRALK
jgi:glycosyltransferase involved in cell wall biosynthesis